MTRGILYFPLCDSFEEQVTIKVEVCIELLEKYFWKEGDVEDLDPSPK